MITITGCSDDVTTGRLSLTKRRLRGHRRTSTRTSVRWIGAVLSLLLSLSMVYLLLSCASAVKMGDAGDGDLFSVFWLKKRHMRMKAYKIRAKGI